MKNQLQILGIVGSLRKDSYHKALLRAAIKLVPESAEILSYENLENIPPFNQDKETNPPESVIKLKDNITSSDAILFVTPEYNYSIPGVLKNAIDWASRPYGESAWEGKPVGIISASPGMVGGARVQYHLRQVFVFLNMFPLNKPEIIIPTIAEKVNESGELTDDFTKEKIRELLQALVDWTVQLKEKPISEEEIENYEYDNAYKKYAGGQPA